MLATGTLLTVDNQIDQSTGTERLKAVFDNKDNALYPNQFVNVHLLLDVEKNARIIPMAAVQRGPQGTYVYVVGSDKKAQVRPVTLKNTQGNDVSIGMELQPGELVVVEGMDRIQDGGRVNVQADGDTAALHLPAAAAAGGGRRTTIMNISAAVYTPPGSDLSFDGGNSACRLCCVYAIAGFGAAGSRLSDDSGRDLLSGREPGRHVVSVTAPLERQFGQVPGLKQMTSTSSFGCSIITLQFGSGSSIDIAEQQVQAAINAGGTFLPRDLPNPPIYSKVNPADTPIMTLALSSPTLPLSQVEDMADTILAQKISQLPGVGLVRISGGQKPGSSDPCQSDRACRIRSEPRGCADGAGLSERRSGERKLRESTTDLQIGANDQIMSSNGYRKIIVRIAKMRRSGCRTSPTLSKMSRIHNKPRG